MGVIFSRLAGIAGWKGLELDFPRPEKKKDCLIFPTGGLSNLLSVSWGLLLLLTLPLFIFIVGLQHLALIFIITGAVLIYVLPKAKAVPVLWVKISAYKTMAYNDGVI